MSEVPDAAEPETAPTNPIRVPLPVANVAIHRELRAHNDKMQQLIRLNVTQVITLMLLLVLVAAGLVFLALEMYFTRHHVAKQQGQVKARSFETPASH